jgi:hypothetical protein
LFYYDALLITRGVVALSRDGRRFHSFPYNTFAAKVTEMTTGLYENYEGISNFDWGEKAHFKLIV